MWLTHTLTGWGFVIDSIQVFVIIHFVVKITVLNMLSRNIMPQKASALCFQRGRPVPVLIPPDCRKPLDFLANTSQRSKAKVVEGNPYLFFNSGMHLSNWLFFKADYCISMNVWILVKFHVAQDFSFHISWDKLNEYIMNCLLHTSFAVNSYARAYDSIKTVCNGVCLSAPHKITSVSKRTYMATLTQVFYHSFLSESLNHTCN